MPRGMQREDDFILYKHIQSTQRKIRIRLVYKNNSKKSFEGGLCMKRYLFLPKKTSLLFPVKLVNFKVIFPAVKHYFPRMSPMPIDSALKTKSIGVKQLKKELATVG